jgi:hypothetical protein
MEIRCVYHCQKVYLFKALLSEWNSIFWNNLYNMHIMEINMEQK